MTRVTLRKVPGALAFGLLASLGAHAALFGGDHAMGGGYNALLVQAAAAGTLCVLIAFGALAWSAAGGTADGSILAARLSSRLPGFIPVLAASALWFGLGEAIEPSHARALALATILCLALASWLVGLIARAVVVALASLVISITRASFSSRTPSWTRRARPIPIARRLLRASRRFARPPPIAIAYRA
jgi:hypothetical protein